MASETIAVGEQIRMFIRHVFGSRLTQHLEEELLRLRSDYDLRLRDREQYIADLRSDVERLRSKVAEYELILIPLTSGGLFGPKPPRIPNNTVATDEPGSWAAEQASWYKKQEEEASKQGAPQ